MPLAPIHRYIGRIIHLMRKEKGMRQSELALLTGLKQPNLSRIENGLVSPRPVTLEKIAKALGVEVQTFYSESKVQEVERKWAASLGPKHAALMLAGKLTAVSLYDTADGWPAQLSSDGLPSGKLEVVLQMPPIEGEPEGTHPFALRVYGDSMQAQGGDNFRPNEVVVFSSSNEPRNGEFGFVLLRDSGTFRRLEFADEQNVKLIPLNSGYETRTVPRADVRKMYRLVRHIKSY